VLEIVREMDGGHTIGAEFAENAIAVGEGGGEPLGRCGHGIGPWREQTTGVNTQGRVGTGLE
jgi:hypothetical protein